MKQEQDLSLLDVFDQQLLKPGEYIFKTRKQFLISFLPEVKKLYSEIAKAGRRNGTAFSKRIKSMHIF
jgi:DNA replication and repair protein RecF